MNKKYIVILAILAVGIFALGVHLATAGPVEVQIGDNTISFLPLVMTSKAADAPSGLLYVFSSEYESQGNFGGRSLVNVLCQYEDPESHFCSMEEIENARATNGVFFEIEFTSSWVDAFDPTSKVFSDSQFNCNGWTSDLDTETGLRISSHAVSSDLTGCQDAFNVACCKQIP